MARTPYTEQAFEDAIENDLITVGGYRRGNRDGFDRTRCIDPSEFIAFVKETQPRQWQSIEGIKGTEAAETVLNDLCRALNSDHEGCLKVLRHGFRCFGQLLHAAYFAPASGLNPETQQRYAANRLTVTRQLRYSDKHTKTLDMVLSLNGIPLVTLELKNPMTGQTHRDAISQYKETRDQGDLIFQFRKRTLVHFAVDTDEVYMTTKLVGKSTQFLPFNKGNDGGAGNPENPDGYKTAYLWQEVLSRDSFLDVLARFIHLEVKEKRVEGRRIVKETMIFPRYHQLDCVRRLISDARVKGVGTNYLVQHSTGSGKSNTIAWFVHQAASLFNDRNEKVFNSVVVVTHRLVLDQQLQNTIYQFEHKDGVVRKIDEDSAQLAAALKAGAPIIVTTLQKFPFVTERIGDLPTRRYAVVIDEAHSSQGSEAAIELKGVLRGESLKEEAQRLIEEEEYTDQEEEIIKTILRRGRQPNISFFAFTATPKYKTIELFGQPGPDGKPVPFHLYSMRQAIEEEFILDVLKHYTTYKTYFRLAKTIEDDPEVEKRRAAKALTRFMSLHERNIARKTQVMVDHFYRITRHKIGGKAKAMVVTSSRLHAVKYKKAFDDYIKKKGYQGIRTLVAFSGTVSDPDVPGLEYTEVKMNQGIKETELPEKFASDQYNILIVAEKYQTGFDQPLLHTMYVDKRLSGIHAVQTLSRLNRTHPGKEDTFVLDFVNEAEEIQEAFQLYYERTIVGERADPKQLYDMQARLDNYGVYRPAEINEFCEIFYRAKSQITAADHKNMDACLRPAAERFIELERDVQEEFQKLLVDYKNLYAFLSQIIPFPDVTLERLYTYGRFLLMKLPAIDQGPDYHFDDEVKLQYYRLQKISEGSITLEKRGSAEVCGPTSVGTGMIHPETVPLSELIDILNDRFGTEFKPADQLFFDSIREDAVANPELQQAAAANTKDNFSFAFRKVLLDLLIGRMEQNERIAARFLDDEDFKDIVTQYLLDQVYARLCPDQVQSQLESRAADGRLEYRLGGH